MILPIYTYGHSVLRKQCNNVSKSYKGLATLINDMFETMYNANGIGISAPQVGLSINLFVIDLSTLSEDDPSVKPTKEVFINPKIISLYGDDKSYNEGCLSIPGIRSDVFRKTKVEIEYYDSNFIKRTSKIDGIFARVFLHEYDHLNKTLFIDHLSGQEKNNLNRKLNSIIKGKFNIDYPTFSQK